jgi:hypothetical protein
VDEDEVVNPSEIGGTKKQVKFLKDLFADND